MKHDCTNRIITFNNFLHEFKLMYQLATFKRSPKLPKSHFTQWKYDFLVMLILCSFQYGIANVMGKYFTCQILPV